ncbi:hypothetical protein WS81_29995 [Burkholderia sp. MSMB2040]|nr:hypothetical protein WS78_20020 [Burkholderia savannae]KVG48769.1 hypothetical protein WS77_03325 [Burkholderia sp. MSMB0265]KVG86229.1 hypothetical protein WS81_29995 [Burkholderia sp. MSMB2040]KVG90507.1 hypothetical protein WS82_17460 [Burkholderia sp. MSMB2041]KVK82206.1 hypothetical protein WS91_09545 [Burkholderia sp. MSMB1498]
MRCRAGAATKCSSSRRRIRGDAAKAASPRSRLVERGRGDRYDESSGAPAAVGVGLLMIWHPWDIARRRPEFEIDIGFDIGLEFDADTNANRDEHVEQFESNIAIA